MSWFSNYFQSSPGQVSSDCTACGSSPKSHGAMEAFRESASTGHLGRSQGESARDRVLHRRHAKSSPSHPPIDAAPHGGDTMGKPAILRLIYGFMAQKQKKTSRELRLREFMLWTLYLQMILPPILGRWEIGRKRQQKKMQPHWLAHSDYDMNVYDDWTTIWDSRVQL